MKAIKFLGCQRLALGGDSDEKIVILTLKAFDSGEITKWLKRKTNKYTSPEIQNEMLKIMALNILRSVVGNISDRFPKSCVMNEQTLQTENS